MKRLVSAALALSLLGTTAAVAAPYGNGNFYNRDNYRGHGDGNGAAIVAGVGLVTLAAILASQHHHRHWHRGWYGNDGYSYGYNGGYGYTNSYGYNGGYGYNDAYNGSYGYDGNYGYNGAYGYERNRDYKGVYGRGDGDRHDGSLDRYHR